MRYLLASAGTIQQYRYGQEHRDVLLPLQEQCIIPDIKSIPVNGGGGGGVGASREKRFTQ
jgi:hypothetical protein